MKIARFILSEPIWSAFFKALTKQDIPDVFTDRTGPRILMMSLNPAGQENGLIARGAPEDLPEQDDGPTAVFPHQGLAQSLPLALMHLWMMTIDTQVTYQALTGTQDFVYLNTDLGDIDGILHTAQLDRNDYDLIITGSTFPGPDINSAEGVQFNIKLWDTKNNEVLYSKDSGEDGRSLNQNISHLATDLTNTIFDRYEVKKKLDYQDTFAFWLRDFNLQVLGVIASQLCSEYASASGLIRNIPRLDRWKETLSELKSLASTYQRSELYLSYFVYLLCRVHAPGVSQAEIDDFKGLCHNIPKEDEYALIFQRLSEAVILNKSSPKEQ